MVTGAAISGEGRLYRSPAAVCRRLRVLVRLEGVEVLVGADVGVSLPVRFLQVSCSEKGLSVGVDSERFRTVEDNSLVLGLFTNYGSTVLNDGWPLFLQKLGFFIPIGFLHKLGFCLKERVWMVFSLELDLYQGRVAPAGNSKMTFGARLPSVVRPPPAGMVLDSGIAIMAQAQSIFSRLGRRYDLVNYEPRGVGGMLSPGGNQLLVVGSVSDGGLELIIELMMYLKREI
ncbi:hypothetical protein NE237_005092 [Protea cynaroides]|uniref:Uncharacterized protein n=1 Tax=Protea cynaroides TaxID=273540 RepID=A0A9Q0KJY1_9MAGN|nr:hypothetical protein NE237_005092 [Protea cynaroides]